ncbi:MAG: TetM/TetW/TetO/TetS family tetracycline resistance ribosomal protection protein, partial [Oscillospiraceae bacterium]|nr:TetM/TetW/TetO/TetS family tetracycline resistance ribosomal protection protein [Oscillospiraceae bacterium]
MRKLVIGILAHVDAGKTTLSEALLYLSGRIRKLGRVDHRDAFLDTDTLERERGITIFSKQAVFPLDEDCTVTLVDTPGHVDFSAEMERVLSVLDCAVLVVSGTDGVQAHTLTLWRLLERYQIPTILFINKMDAPGTDRGALLAALRTQLGGTFADFGATREQLYEDAALCNETVMEQYLEHGELDDDTLRSLITQRKLFPCCFGAALRLDGVEEFLAVLDRYAPRPVYGDTFAARVYKVGRDHQGKRLTYLKVTGGTLRVKQVLSGGSGEDAWEEKIDQIRIYSGTKFEPVDEACAGSVCAVTGLTHTACGDALGAQEQGQSPALEPVLNYQLLLPDGVDAHTALEKLRQLQEEDPLLHIDWNARLQEIHIRLMGQVQLEILQRVIAERFGMAVEFGTGSIVYKETIESPSQGVGHYEPLRHYAEVHLLLEPLERGRGLEFATLVGEDDLDRNWQRLILTHLMEKVHLGVLTGSPITDMRLTIIGGRAHLKHTEGGDFRQATYRAIRQGLMRSKSVLLEPWYDFRLEIPAENLGRAINDIQQMSGRFDAPET